MASLLHPEITLGENDSAITFEADVAGLGPLMAETPMTVYQGIASTTIQTAPIRLIGTEITLKASGTDLLRGAGHITQAQLAALYAIQDAAAAGTPVDYADSLGNEGTVIPRRVSGIPQVGAEADLIALDLVLVWASVSKRAGVEYSGG